MKRFLLPAAGLALAASALLAAPAGAQAANGTVYVVHGVPGLTVDVFVNGNKALSGFAPKQVAGPLSLPAGDYEVKICPASTEAAPCATPAIQGSATLPGGANVSLVAHLDAAGTPKLGVFVNDVKPSAAGQGRLIVRHTAAAPAVDVLANGTAAFKGVTNGQEGMADLPAGTVSAAVVAAGTTTPVLIGPADVPVEAGKATVVYAIGSASASPATLDVAVQSIPLEAAGAVVNTGTSGLLDQDSGMPVWVWALAVLGVLGLAGTGAAVATARSRG